MNEQRISELESKVDELTKFIESLKTGPAFPLSVSRALIANGFFKLNSPLGTGVLYSSGGVITTVTGASSTVYVALISGGSPTQPVAISNGIVTAI